jgi:ornithine cyclodeaminase/alanine dehydrogenase-like protein (mu-crystallin family)
VQILSRADVESRLDLDELIDALALAMADLSSGAASSPARIVAEVPERGGFLGAMPAYVPSIRVLMAKLVSLFPENRDLPTHQALIAAFNPDNGEPIAVMDGTAITAIRTGAGSALSARVLARPDASVLAILGTGVQARSHARAVCRVRPITEVRIAGRDPAKAQALADELADLADVVLPANSYAEALAGAHIACATTHSVEPVVRREWLDPGTHVTSVGFNASGRELDDATVADALVVVESRAAALAPHPGGASDLLGPLRDGIITADLTELGEVLNGSRPGRTDADQITLYKSVGVGVQDAAAAALVLKAGV